MGPSWVLISYNICPPRNNRKYACRISTSQSQIDTKTQEVRSLEDSTGTDHAFGPEVEGYEVGVYALRVEPKQL